MSMSIFNSSDLRLNLSVPFLFVFVVLVFGLCFLKQRAKCHREQICQGKNHNSHCFPYIIFEWSAGTTELYYSSKKRELCDEKT